MRDITSSPSDGEPDGWPVGEIEGELDGATLGTKDGEDVGPTDGVDDTSEVGEAEGSRVSSSNTGAKLGLAEVFIVGTTDAVGATDSATGAGASDGDALGSALGAAVAEITVLFWTSRQVVEPITLDGKSQVWQIVSSLDVLPMFG